MLYRMVGPMKRDRPRFRMHVRRIPVDARDRLVGRRLRFPLGETTRIVTISPRAQSIRFSPSARTIRQKRRKETRQQIRHLRLAYAPCKTLKIVEWARPSTCMHQKNGPPKASRLFLFFLARSECRLPTRCSSLLARCRCYRFDLFFSRLFRFSIPFLLAFSHAILHELMVKLPRLGAN